MLGGDHVRAAVEAMFGGDLRAQLVVSLGNGVVGVLTVEPSLEYGVRREGELCAHFDSRRSRTCSHSRGGGGAISLGVAIGGA